MKYMYTLGCSNFPTTGNKGLCFVIGKDQQIRDLRKMLRRSKKAAFAQGTRSNLMVQWRSFLSFCFFFQLPWLPTNAETLALYAQFLSFTFKATSSVSNYICGAKMLHTLTDTPAPAFQALELKLALRGLARLNPHCPKQASPITPQILLAVYAHLDLTKYEHAVFWALFLVAYFTFARKSNLVQTGDQGTQLRRQDVMVGSRGLVITFHWSKTIQFGERKLVVPVVSIPQSVLCPVSAYKHMCRLVPGPKSGPAFVLLHGTGLSPVTYYQYQVFIRKVIAKVGLDPSLFSSHSFRRGGATWAFRAQVPGELVKVHGDWRSDAYLKYLDFSLDQRLLVAQAMVQGLPS